MVWNNLESFSRTVQRRPIRRPLYGYCTIAATELETIENKGVKMVARDGIEPPRGAENR